MSTSSVNAHELIGASTHAHILESILAALNQGKFSEVLDQFDDHFTFKDHALDIEFTDKGAPDRILSQIARVLSGQCRRG